MIWTLNQVAVMEGYMFSQTVDMFLVEREAQADGTNPVIDATIDHLFKGLQAAAHTWALEIDRDDIEWKVTPAEDGHFLDVVRARWRPATTAGLMIGGPIGGKVYTMEPQLHRKGIAVAVERTMDPAAMWTPGTAFPETELHDVLFYAYAGWSENRRMWVYRVDSKK